jgi:HAD superfamily hydrolase (TIGR01662 family)
VTVTTVVFDVGETLVDESRAHAVYAERAGVNPFLFFAAIGALIERRENHRGVLEMLGVDEKVDHVPYELGDLYDDALPALRALRGEGYRVGVVGNQPSQTEAFLREAGCEVDFVSSSETLRVSKPQPAFFDRVVELAGAPPEQIAYVGDRVDNDVLPAKRVGMLAVFVRRGPWGWLQSEWPEVELADIRLDSLLDLPDALRRV